LDGTTETVKTDFFTDLEEMIGFLETFKAKNFNPPNQEIRLKEAMMREDIDRILRDARLTHALNRKE
jgi:hypothetical protein